MQNKQNEIHLLNCRQRNSNFHDACMQCMQYIQFKLKPFYTSSIATTSETGVSIFLLGVSSLLKPYVVMITAGYCQHPSSVQLMSPRPMHLVMHSSHCVRVSVHGGGEIRLVTGVQCPLSTCWCWCPARGSHSHMSLTWPPDRTTTSRARVSQQCHAFHGNNDSINIYASMLFISFDSRTR